MTTHADLTRRIDAHLRRAASRIRARRLVVTLSAAGLGVALVGAIAASYEAAQVLAGAEGDAATVTDSARIWIVVAVLVACAIAWTRGVSRVALARDVDRRLGLADRTATAIALAGGAVASPLGDRVLADTTASLDAAGAELDRAFPARPRGAVLHTLRAGSVLVAIWVAIVLASRLIGSGGGGSDAPFLPGDAPRPTDTAQVPPPDEPETAGPDAPPPEDEPDEPDEPDAPDEPDEPDVTPPDDPEPEPPPPPAGPQATAELVLSSQVFDPGDDVLALGVARPGAGLTAPAGFHLSVEIDGTVLGTGDAVALDPAAERGALTPLRLGRLAGAPELLRPGEHEAVLLLEPEDGGAIVRSEPQRFRIRGDQEGDSPQGQPPPPPPEPEPDPSAPPPPEPPPAEPEDGGGGDQAPPEEAEAPELPEQTERKVVVPLFRDGDEIEKTGLRLVLVPGGGPESPPKSVPLADALDEARRRAETAVDRAGVRAEDRDLVRRYFERLRRLADPPR